MTGAEFGEVDFDLLADYIGGALEGTPEESAVAALVATDSSWREAYGELSAGMAAVGTELGRLAPEPMPADLAARLEELFAAEPAAEPSSGVAADTAAEDRPVSLTLVHDADAPEGGARRVPRKGRRLRWATPIAVAAGAVAFVGFGLDYVAGRDSSGSADSAASGLAGESYASQDNSAAGSGGDLQTLDSGTDYTRATLGVPPSMAALSAPQPNVPSTERKQTEAPERAAEGDALARLRPRSALQACLDAIAAENAAGPISQLSVDYAQFNGAPAVVVRFTARNGTWAWASGPACGTAAGAATLDKVPVR